MLASALPRAMTSFHHRIPYLYPSPAALFPRNISHFSFIFIRFPRGSSSISTFFIICLEISAFQRLPPFFIVPVPLYRSFKRLVKIIFCLPSELFKFPRIQGVPPVMRRPVLYRTLLCPRSCRAPLLFPLQRVYSAPQRRRLYYKPRRARPYAARCRCRSSYPRHISSS